MPELPKIIFSASTYCPTSPLTGLSGKTVLRLQNMYLTGASPDIYLQCYAGSLNLNETIPTLDLTGTIDCPQDDLNIVGTGTLFTTELCSGQMFWAGDSPLRVDKIIDDTHLTVYRGPLTALVAATGERTPVIYELARQRATQISGNGLQFDMGSILAAGWGTLRVNGSVLQGDSMVLTGKPQIAYFDPLTGNYNVTDIGFDTPTVAPTLSDDASGTVGMQAGDYSIRLVPSNDVTDGYNNPGPRANVSLASANHRIKVDVSAVTMDTAANQNAWDVYATQLGVVNVNQGPWNFVRTVSLAEINAGPNFFYIEYLNAEIARQGELSFDSDPPPDSVSFVTTLQGYPQWVGCNGKFSGAPGPSLVPAVPQDLEAAPAIWNVTSSPPEDILGVITFLARLYILCPQTLQQGIYAPTGDPLVPPTQIRPFWQLGFGNPYQLIGAQDVVIGYPHGGPTRSTADVETVETQFLGANVAAIIKSWVSAEVLVAWDSNPNVNAVCFFYPANSLNDAGFWTTRVLMWGFDQRAWIGDVLLSSDDHDMVVTGVANISNQLYFLAGGRNGSDIVIETFAWNVISGDAVPYYVAWEVQAGEIVDRNKTVKAARANGKFTNGQLQIYGFDSNKAVNLTDIETGQNAQITLSLGTTDDTETTFRKRFNAPNNFIYTARVSGTYNGSDETIDKINGCVIEYMPSSGLR